MSCPAHRHVLWMLTFSAMMACDPGGAGQTDAAVDAVADAASTADGDADAVSGSEIPPDPGPEVASDASTTSDATAPDDLTPLDAMTDADAALPRAEWPPPALVGGKRAAEVLVPASYDGYAPVPAVLLLGGYDYFARDLDDWVLLSERVDSRAFLLVLPDGLVDEDGSPYWNATDTCCDYYESGVDDVAWLSGILAELRARFAVSRIAIWGHSAGAFMAYRMACEDPKQLASIVSIAGSGWLDPLDCAVRDEPLSLLQVHGLKDDIMPFAGDDEAPGALEMTQRFAARNGCTPASWASAESAVKYVPKGTTTLWSYASGCAPGTDVSLWTFSASDHYPNFTPAFTDAALDWTFQQGAP
ncbi:MAG: alpha/beta hydrolase-fold protein [Myxococcota bacterium]